MYLQYEGSRQLGGSWARVGGGAVAPLRAGSRAPVEMNAGSERARGRERDGRAPSGKHDVMISEVRLS